MLLGIIFRKNISRLDDQELLGMVRAGNKQAMGELFVRYSWLVMGQCLKYLKNRMQAEDETMTIFEKLPEKIERSEISNFRSWLFSVSKNECLMKLRKAGIKETDAENALLFTEDQSANDMRLATLNEEKLKMLEECIGKLSGEQKQCVELFYLSDKSYEEISNETGFELKHVKSYIQNGKRNLKIMLEKNDAFRD